MTDDIDNLQEIVSMLEKRIGPVLSDATTAEDFNAYKEPTPDGLSEASLAVLVMVNKVRTLRYQVKSLIQRASL